MSSTKRQSEPIRLFYSYSHKDEDLRDELEKHLSLLRRQGVIQPWHDRKISPGRKWKRDIDKNLEAADIILLLISADFLNSDYCYGVEMARALERDEVEEALVIPIIIRPVTWKGTPIEDLQVLPKNGKPIISWKNRDEAWAHVAKEIGIAINEWVDGCATNFRLLEKIKPQKFRKKVLSLEDYRAGAEILRDLVEWHHNFAPEILIAVNQGGMATAAVMNKHWRKPVGVMYTAAERGVRVITDISLPIEIEPLAGTAGHEIKLLPSQPKKILVVDPKLKTGESAERIQDILQRAYGQDVDIRYAIVLGYGRWERSRWKVIHPTPYEWPVRFKPKNLDVYVAYYTDCVPPPDKITEELRPGRRSL